MRETTNNTADKAEVAVNKRRSFQGQATMDIIPKKFASTLVLDKEKEKGRPCSAQKESSTNLQEIVE